MIGKLIPIILLLTCCGAGPVAAQGLTLDQIVDGAYHRDSTDRANIVDWKATSETFSRRLNDDSTVKEEKKFLKTYFIKDSLCAEQFQEYYLDGKKQDEKSLESEARDSAKARRKGRSRDLSANPIKPFYPNLRREYDFTLAGSETKDGYACYHVGATGKIKDQNRIDGDFWFETDSLRLVQADFHPSKLPTAIKYLNMTMIYAPTSQGNWLPARFHLSGFGRVLLFIKFRFSVDETYSNHAVNIGLTDEIFREKNNEN
jgi:hypothetical protein